ncbi:MAG: hypothetical protein K2H60_13135 [Muribaculaceae bacterium]|nr:hypothetical protein [Muribaculaceae bacterium]
MTNLFRHIEFLLLRHDCVIVPGLGAFIVTTTPARIDHDTRRIFPPYRSVMFNQAVTLDDGLLANSYARSLSLTFEEARQVILKDVASLHNSLRTNRVIEIGRLGQLSMGEEDQLQFSPSKAPDAISSLVGLSSISLPDARKAAKQRAISSKRLAEKNEDSPYYHFRINRTVIKFTAVFAVVLALALAVIMYPVPHDSREQRASVVPVEVLIPTAKQKATPAPAIESNVPAPTEVTAEPTVKIEKPAPSYYMIVATFHSKKEAERYAATHSSDEYPLEAVSSRKLTRVSAASSNNKEELIRKLNSPTVAKRFPNAWIWTSSD